MMLKDESQFLVVAIPSDVSPDLSSFQVDLQEKIQSQEFKSHLELTIHDVTQLMDEEDLGDCFVVALSFNSRDTSSADDDNHTNNKSDVDIIINKLMDDTRAEVWVTSTAAIPLAPPYGWNREIFLWDKTASTDSLCDCLRKYGLAMVCDANSNGGTINDQHYEINLASNFFADATAKLQAHVTHLEQTVIENHPHIQLGESAFGFQEYTHRGPGRFEVLFDPSSVLYQQLRDGLESKWIDCVCQYLQSDRSRLRLNISCVYSRPGATDQEWHTDGDHYTGSHTNTVGDYRNHQPYALCIFVPLIPLTTETGFTRFWPKSHLYPNLLGLARAADALQATVDGINLHPGDYVMYDYTTWHKGVGNTGNVERPIIQFLYSCDWYKERKNYGTQSVFEKGGAQTVG